jgi:hypothetical protein
MIGNNMRSTFLAFPVLAVVGLCGCAGGTSQVYRTTYDGSLTAHVGSDHLSYQQGVVRVNERETPVPPGTKNVLIVDTGDAFAIQADDRIIATVAKKP